MTFSPTILIVEDDPVFRRVMSFTVEKAGFNVETASHGQLGYDRLVQGGIDFLVTDLQMPICSGLELLERLQDVPNYQRPGTVLCTAKGMELDTEQLIKRWGLVTVMHKPFSPRKLSVVIQKYLKPTDSIEESAGSIVAARFPSSASTQHTANTQHEAQ